MTILDKLAHFVFGPHQYVFGPHGGHDLDLPDEPLSPVSQLERRLGTDTEASASARLEAVMADGPTAPDGYSGAVGHLPTDWANIRRDLAHLRSVLQEALVWLDEIDPTPRGLAALADVTNISTRKGRPSHP